MNAKLKKWVDAALQIAKTLRNGIVAAIRGHNRMMRTNPTYRMAFARVVHYTVTAIAASALAAAFSWLAPAAMAGAILYLAWYEINGDALFGFGPQPAN